MIGIFESGHPDTLREGSGDLAHMLGQIRDPGSGKVPVIFPALPLADPFTATARLSPLHVYTSHTRPLYTSLPTRQNIEAARKARTWCLAARWRYPHTFPECPVQPQ